MTEAEWLTANDPSPMLEFLKRRVSDRKLRLFAVACCRSIWTLIADERSRNAVEVAESFADGKAATHQLQEAYNLAEASTEDAYAAVHDAAERIANELNLPPEDWIHGAWECAMDATYLNRAVVAASSVEIDEALEAARDVALAVVHRASPLYFSEECNPDFSKREVAEQEHRVLEARFVHCIFGNPFRPVVVDPSWLSSTVVAIAHGIYDDKAFDRLPILADALQDAGCENADILTHLRGDGPHVRGCWALDLVLGKQ